MKKFLIINPFGIGDVLFSTALVRAVKKAYPESFIGYLCNENVAPILSNNPAIDKLFFYSRGDLKKIRRRSRWEFFKTFARAFRDLHAQHFDFSLDLSMVTHYSVMLWLIGIPQRYGFNYKGRGYFLTKALPADGFKRRHVIYYYEELLSLCGIPMDEKRLDLYVNDKDRAWAADFLAGAESGRGIIIGVSPFGGGSWGENAKHKQWPLERFASVIKTLLSRVPGRVIVFGTASDAQNGKILLEHIGGGNVINAIGRTDLGQCAALLEKCNLFIANDSGPLHMACALGIKTISVFGPVDERVYGPVGEKNSHRVITAPVDCRPCYVNFSKPYCATMRCLLDINENDVIQSAMELIEKDRSPKDEGRNS